MRRVGGHAAVSRLANDNFEGSSLASWWVPLQADLLTSGWTVGGGYLQAVVDTHVLTYNDEIGCCLGQPMLRPASGLAFDVACELEAFSADFSGAPAEGAPRIVALGWWRPQFNVTGAAAGGGLTADDVEDAHMGVGRAPGMSGGTGLVRERKRTIASVSDWETVAGAARAWVRLRCEDDELSFFYAESIGTPGSGAIPAPGDYTAFGTADVSAMQRFGFVGPRIYTNTNGIGGRFYRFLNVNG
jgi:hypothetical protein